MAKINLTPKKIYEQEFKTSMRGYDKKEVDEFLDDVIKDYGQMIDLIDFLTIRVRKSCASLRADIIDISNPTLLSQHSSERKEKMITPVHKGIRHLKSLHFPFLQ